MLKKHHLITVAALMVPCAMAQFDSGSSGEDGALNITSNTTLQIQEDGVHEYTTINVASGVTLSFAHNDLNTPVKFLATGDVTIAGTINIDGARGVEYNEAAAGTPGSEAVPGPGGFPGGIGAQSLVGVHSRGAAGGGPGGGAAANTDTLSGGLGAAGNAGSHATVGAVGGGNPNPAAPTYGDPRLITLSGGSGGAGGNVYVTTPVTTDAPGGGAGGGAILIASSGNITVSGSINARGGQGYGAAGFNGGGSRGSGGGAGGAVRLMANNITGNGFIRTTGGGGGINGGDGYSVLEAFGFSGNLVQNSTPPPRTVAAPTVVAIDDLDQPTVKIVAIDSIPVPEPPSGSTTSPDVTIPDTTANPVAIDVTTTNVPDGAVVNLRITRAGGEVEIASGEVVSNGVTISADLEDGIGVIYATVDFP